METLDKFVKWPKMGEEGDRANDKVLYKFCIKYEINVNFELARMSKPAGSSVTATSHTWQLKLKLIKIK